MYIICMIYIYIYIYIYILYVIHINPHLYDPPERSIWNKIKKSSKLSHDL